MLQNECQKHTNNNVSGEQSAAGALGLTTLPPTVSRFSIFFLEAE
jgi:hypothetical protein